MKRIFAIFFACVVFAGCQVVEPPPVSILSSSPDSRFAGSWEAKTYGDIVYDQYAFYEYSFLTINDSNKLYEYRNREEFGNQVQGYPYGINLEWKIENEKLVTRAWNNQYDNWIPWDFSFPDSAHLVLSRTVNSRTIIYSYVKQ